MTIRMQNEWFPHTSMCFFSPVGTRSVPTTSPCTPHNSNSTPTSRIATGGLSGGGGFSAGWWPKCSRHRRKP